MQLYIPKLTVRNGITKIHSLFWFYLRLPTMYTLVRKVLFLFDAESVHHFAMQSFKILCQSGFKNIVHRSFSLQDQRLEKNFLGLHFTNPVGLAAGFDKNALYLNELQALGFGFVEIGTVTPLPQKGNDRPRLFRLPADKALINRMGFNNDGVKVIAQRLKEWNLKTSKQPNKLIIGGNIGKNKATSNEEAWKDYEICFRELFDCVDYFVVNVSSPNTPGLRELQEKDSLKKILGHLQTINQAQPSPKPLLLKIAPDLTTSQIDDVIDLAMEIKLDGLVAANTTISRENLQTPAAKITAIGNGGLSGKPLEKKSTEIVAYIHQRTGGRLPIIASGGIFTGVDAQEKLNNGADLIQVWTGFIYEGPACAKKICRYLLQASGQNQ